MAWAPRGPHRMRLSPFATRQMLIRVCVCVCVSLSSHTTSPFPEPFQGLWGIQMPCLGNHEDPVLKQDRTHQPPRCWAAGALLIWLPPPSLFSRKAPQPRLWEDAHMVMGFERKKCLGCRPARQVPCSQIERMATSSRTRWLRQRGSFCWLATTGFLAFLLNCIQKKSYSHFFLLAQRLSLDNQSGMIGWAEVCSWPEEVVESGIGRIGRKVCFCFLLVCGRYKTGAMVAFLASLKLLSLSLSLWDFAMSLLSPSDGADGIL